MMIHPLMLYTGFVGFAVPFAFAFAALVDRPARHDLVPHHPALDAGCRGLFLSIGIILGGRWAYEVLGWGGYWAWDPVENASFMPWLVGTAYLHSVMIQEKRDMLKIWNLVLIGLTYTLCLFGTFLTRSGIVQSVHAFAQTPLVRRDLPGLRGGDRSSSFFSGAASIAARSCGALSALESVVSREASFMHQQLALPGDPGGRVLGDPVPGVLRVR